MQADADAGACGEASARGATADADAVVTGHAEALLCSVQPERDPAAERAAELVARVTADPGLRRVDELAAASGLTVRGLQRLLPTTWASARSG